MLAVVLTGCGGSLNASASTDSGPAAEPTLIPTRVPGDAKPVLANSELVVGANRFVLGMIDSNTGNPILDVPDVSLQFFKVNPDGTAVKVGDANTVYQDDNLPAGLFVAHVSFDQAGHWGALVTIKRQGRAPTQEKLDFDVLTRGSAPMIGDPAPASKNLTSKDVKDLNTICSARPNDDMHDMTIADAIKSGKPTVILFATPGFCETATCGPDLEVAQKLEDKYRGKANFIHIETPADHPNAPQAQRPTVDQWGLHTEPWIFFVDKDGKIANRFEGGLTFQELDPEFQKLIK